MNYCVKQDCGSEMKKISEVVDGVGVEFDKCPKCGYIDPDSKKIG